MSAEFNKVLCAILSAILVLLLSSFISELLYHPKKTENKISYLIEEEGAEESKVTSETKTLEDSTISSKDIEELLGSVSLGFKMNLL